MNVSKIINNNVICSVDENNHEIVVMGRGIGFGKRCGQEIDESKIEKIFKIEVPDELEQFKNLLSNLPLEYVQISNEIISYAKTNLNMELSHNVYLFLTDHISFAINRFKEGMIFSNELLTEVKRFYPEEFSVGMWGLSLIKQKIGINLPEDEAASIALHLVTAEYNIKVRDSFTITQVIDGILDIINEEIPLPIEDSLNKDRMVTDLKSLAYRLLMLPQEDNWRDEVFLDFVKSHCQKECAIVQRIGKFVEENFSCQMTEEEEIYMALNIKRLKDALKKGE